MKCIVMQIENGQAVVLDSKGSFMTIKDRGYCVGQTIQYRNTSLRSVCAAAASLIAVIGIGTGGYKLYYTPVSYLSIEINPSIQLSINIFDRVIGYEYFNNDGKLILDDVNIQNSKSRLSVEKIIDTAQSQGYLSENNNSVIIDVVENNTAIMKNLTPLKDEYIPKNIDVVVERATVEDAKLSKEKNISIAKAKAVNEYSQVFGGSVNDNSEALKEISVKELRKKNSEVISTLMPTPEAQATQTPEIIANPLQTQKPKAKESVNNRNNSTKQKPALKSSLSGLKQETNNGEKIEKQFFENSFNNEEKKDKNKTEEIQVAPEITKAPEIKVQTTYMPEVVDKENHFGNGFIKENTSKPKEIESDSMEKKDKTDVNEKWYNDSEKENNSFEDKKTDNENKTASSRNESFSDDLPSSTISGDKASVSEAVSSDRGNNKADRNENVSKPSHSDKGNSSAVSTNDANKGSSVKNTDKTSSPVKNTGSANGTSTGKSNGAATTDSGSKGNNKGSASAPSKGESVSNAPKSNSSPKSGAVSSGSSSSKKSGGEGAGPKGSSQAPKERK